MKIKILNFMVTFTSAALLGGCGGDSAPEPVNNEVKPFTVLLNNVHVVDQNDNDVPVSTAGISNSGKLE